MVRILLSSISAPLPLRPPRVHSRDKCSQAFPVFSWSSATVYYCEHKWKVKSGTVARYMCTCVLDKYRLEVWQAHYKGDRISHTIATWQLPLLHVYRRHKISTWRTLKDQQKKNDTTIITSFQHLALSCKLYMYVYYKTLMGSSQSLNKSISINRHQHCLFYGLLPIRQPTPARTHTPSITPMYICHS